MNKVQLYAWGILFKMIALLLRITLWSVEQDHYKEFEILATMGTEFLEKETHRLEELGEIA